MTRTTDYEVIVHREVYPEGSWWVFDIPALGAAGQTTRLADVAPESRSIIAMWDEDGPDEADVHVTVRLEGEAEARRIWEQSEAEERAARAALDRAAARRREAVALLRDKQHYSAADAARVLGVSRQRIYQLSR
ncbi:XRE family transcriptional regulator [Propionibacterium australiense]|uniref:XRE family transcriptional regulator n=1 Tax=Propionibacterium australiense TaxID=119981 RepID=A0A383S8W8_9ACTN|nr:XRE family transcriptional regulator [Propionibacterium australiense]RLP06437.1 XRE family transcriptional regulator [Propionibacterium australiense]RLP06844.1 XRE family transcriptional regulator [Propionibacterium australiense]SYZ34465.1 Hypothetical protein PROPAUS_2481 [Propionibacterium australiense]VEH89987.1 Uncharacterised protein [Propionibacterium australiense]